MLLIIVPVFNYFDIPYQAPSLQHFILSSTLTLILASLSWQFIELPINNLKRHFQYIPQPAVEHASCW